MTLVLDPTVGGTSANTYASRAEATAYAEATPYATAWAAATDAVRDAALVQAARILDAMAPWRGQRVTYLQAREWPRQWVVGPSGDTYLLTEVPPAVKDAQALLAAWLVAQGTGADPFGLNSNAALDSLSVGPIALKFASGAPTSGPQFLFDTVLPILRAGRCVGAVGATRLVR